MWYINILAALMASEAVATSNIPMVMMAVGSTGTGKSSLLNSLLCPSKLTREFKTCHFKTGSGAKSTTKLIQSVTGQWLHDDDASKHNGEVVVYDTPGLADTENKDSQTLERITNTIEIHEHGYIRSILLVFKGSDKFDANIQKQLKTLEYIFGSSFWNHVITCFTFYGFNNFHIKNRIKTCKQEKNQNNDPNVDVCDSLDYENKKQEEWKKEYKDRFKVTVDIPAVFIHPVFDYDNLQEKMHFFKYANQLWEEALKMEEMRCDSECNTRLSIAMNDQKGHPTILGEKISRIELGNPLTLVCHVYLGIGTPDNSKKIHWERDGVTVQENDDDRMTITSHVISEVTQESRMEITDTLVDYTGEYNCKYGRSFFIKSLPVQRTIYELTVAGLSKSLYEGKGISEKSEWFRKQRKDKDRLDIFTKFKLSPSETKNILDEGTTDSERLGILSSDETIRKKYEKATDCFNNKKCSDKIAELKESLNAIESELHKPFYVAPRNTKNEEILPTKLTKLSAEMEHILDKSDLETEEKVAMSLKIKNSASEIVDPEVKHFYRAMLTKLPKEIDQQNTDSFIKSQENKIKGTQKFKLKKQLAIAKLERKINEEITKTIKSKVINEIDKSNSLPRKERIELKKNIEKSKNTNDFKKYVKDTFTKQKTITTNEIEKFKERSLRAQKVKKATSHMKTQIPSISSEGNLNKVSNSITQINGARLKFEAGGDLNQVSGALDVVQALAVFGGPTGMQVAATANLANTILGICGAGGPPMTTVVANMINKQTEQIKNMFEEQSKLLLFELDNLDNKIKEEIRKHTKVILKAIEDQSNKVTETQFNDRKQLIDGIMKSLELDYVFLATFRGKEPITDISTVQNTVTSTKHATHFGKLMSFNYLFCSNGWNVRFCHILIYSYVILAGLRDSVLTELTFIYKRSSHPDSDNLAAAVYKVLRKYQDDDKNDLTSMLTHSKDQNTCITACTINEIKNTIAHTDRELEKDNYNKSPLTLEQMKLIFKYFKLIGGEKKKFDKESCPTCYESQPCKTTGRDPDKMCIKEWTEWSAWSGCSVTCGGGTQTRTRSCQMKEAYVCVGSDKETQPCNEHSCPTTTTTTTRAPNIAPWGAVQKCSAPWC